jgi:hypothetical protein
LVPKVWSLRQCNGHARFNDDKKAQQAPEKLGLDQHATALRRSGTRAILPLGTPVRGIHSTTPSGEVFILEGVQHTNAPNSGHGNPEPYDSEQGKL